MGPHSGDMVGAGKVGVRPMQSVAEFSGLASDSREVKPGYLFAALPGTKADGSAYIAEEVKRGVWQAGGFPVEIPAMPVNETYMKPSPMMYRNFLAMETEELMRSQPIDGAVLMGGCDKTTPGLLMGAISMNLPAIYLPAGPMLRGNWN